MSRVLGSPCQLCYSCPPPQYQAPQQPEEGVHWSGHSGSPNRNLYPQLPQELCLMPIDCLGGSPGPLLGPAAWARMKAKLSIIHAPAPPHFPCLAGCKYFTGFGSRDSLAETPRMRLKEAFPFPRDPSQVPGRRGSRSQLGE